MQKEKTGNIVVGFIVVALFVGFLVYISIHRKTEAPAQSLANVQLVNNETENNNMTNSQADSNPTPDAPQQANETSQVKGVKITVLSSGTGQMAKAGDTVAMNYTGRLTDGTVFDSNVDPKFNHVELFVFTLGEGMVIQGWDIGVAGMKAGEKRNLVIEPEYGYGARGAGNLIPPNATLIFDVELVAIKQ